MRIGILGGTFNPPHLGHLACAQEAHLQLELDRVLLVPARVPPHKPVEDEPGSEHRLELCRLALTGNSARFEVSELELNRPGPSYTVDTLEELHSRAPDSELFLIVGGDAAVGLPSWHRAERLVSLATPAVAGRPGIGPAAVEGALRELSGGDRARFFSMPEIAVSSTMLRKRVKSGQPIKYYTPDSVIAYIDRYQLYRSRSAR